MSKKITVQLSKDGIKKAASELKKYAEWIETKEKELRIRLAQHGATAASIQFARAIYNGTNDVSVRVDDTGSVAVIYAEGSAVAFIEFGSGKKYGYGHPQAGELGMGPGTYPEGMGHWDDPKGWWFGSHEHSFGNPPAMAMYKAVQEIAESITEIAKEVFAQ